MNRIQLLDSDTINQIAAGEVIERPASIVKELVENAIDAGASSVHVEIRDGGISYIRVTDNGGGIPQDEIRTAFLRHSTSKIRTAADLTHIASLGFRGEALASIAAVARVEVLTRVPSALTGTRYVIEGGAEKVMEEIACPVGTTFRVENLFFNVPVRKKFLKKPVTEASYVTDFMQRIVMGHPEISFQYLKQGKEPSIHSPGNNRLKNSVFAVYGRDMVGSMMELDHEGIVTIRGMISKPQMVRSNRNYENYYLNGRYIKSKIIEKALDDAYRDYVVPGTYPIVVLNIQMDPAMLDVNVHPTKMEVRFTEEDLVAETLFEAVSTVLRGKDLTAKVHGEVRMNPQILPAEGPITPASISLPEVLRKDPSEPVAVSEPIPRRESVSTPVQTQPLTPAAPDLSDEELAALRQKRQALMTERNSTQMDLSGIPASGSAGHGTLQDEPTVYGGGNPNAAIRNGVPAQQEQVSAPKLPETLHLVGQIFRTYWIAEDRDVMYLIDQHAAHERVLYDRLKEKLAGGSLDSQILLEPLSVKLPPKAFDLVMQHEALFRRLGYSIEAFGEDVVLIREVPYIFNGNLGKNDFQTMVDLLEEGGRQVDEDILVDRMAMISCKAAVKGNDALTFEEMNSLLDQMRISPNPFNCPHGRPTMMTMTKGELERRFKR